MRWFRSFSLLKIKLLSFYPKVLRDEWWEYRVRHQMYLLEARFAYSCKHGYSIDKANKKLERMLQSLPVFPSSIKFEKELEEKNSKLLPKKIPGGIL